MAKCQAPKPAKWNQRVDQFVAYLTEQERSELTKRYYRDDLTAFAAWYETEYQAPPELAELSARELLAWKAALVKRELAPQSVNRRLAAVRSFLRWAQAKKFAKPIVTPKTVRHETPKPRWLTRREELALLRAVERADDSRDEAIVKVLLNTGLRVSELASLTWNKIQISKRKGSVTVTGKGRKQRTIPLNVEARDALLDLGGCQHDGTARAVLHGQRGRLTIRGIQNVVESYRAAAKLPDLTAHVLRHTFCKRLAEQKTGLEVIASLAGHESIETTRRYTEPGQEDLAAAVESLAADE
jgi:integrase/recombinase XerC